MIDELLIYRSRVSKGHMFLSFILLLYLVVQEISGSSLYGTKGLAFALILISLDISIVLFQLYTNTISWNVIRIVQLIMLSMGYLEMMTRISSTFLGILLMVTMMELMMVVDFTDIYARAMILMATCLPAVIYMVVMLFVNPGDQIEFFSKICSYVMIVLFIVILTNFISEIIVTTDNKVFELRRLSENMKEANEALRIQQEKVKKANEELGIQKIKLETAYNKINSANAETTIQNMILKYISSSLEITTLLNLITESIFEAIGLDLCAVVIQPGIAGNDKILYRIRTRLGDKSEELLSKKIEWGCIDQYVKLEGTYVDNQVDPAKYIFLENLSVNSLLIVPLVRDNVILGALIGGKAQYEFFSDNISFFETVVTQLHVAIYNASLYAKMQQMATRDALTGIYNRGQLNILLDQYSKEARENSTPLSVALFDIDHFKHINDTYGHLLGDVVIKQIAIYAKDTAKKYNGIAARYGGEEFVLVLPEKRVPEATDIINELRDRICSMKIQHEREIVTAKVSVGLSCYPETCTHITELLNRADGAMYYSKKNGRNQLTVDSDKIYNAVKKNNR